MQGVDEDATLTQLCLAWTHVASGGSKLQEAAYIYDELADKFEATVSRTQRLRAPQPNKTKQKKNRTYKRCAPVRTLAKTVGCVLC